MADTAKEWLKSQPVKLEHRKNLRYCLPCIKCKNQAPFFLDEIIKLCPHCWEEWRKHKNICEG